MLKGVNRQVLEVSRPESRYFERILFVVKPEFSSLSAAKLLKEAETMADTAAVPPPKVHTAQIKKRSQNILIAALCVICIVCIIALVLK